jgi:uncharacterized protein YceK
MSEPLKLMILAFLGVSMSGCGTVYNLTCDEPKVYGGILRDMEFDGLTKGLSGTDPIGQGAMPLVAVAGCLAAAEVSLSLAGDTLTLPITVSLQVHRLAAAKSAGPKREVPAPADQESSLTRSPESVLAPRPAVEVLDGGLTFWTPIIYGDSVAPGPIPSPLNPGCDVVNPEGQLSQPVFDLLLLKPEDLEGKSR